LVLCEKDPEDIYIRESDWKVCRVDFSQAFSPFTEIPADTEITRCSKKFFHNLQKMVAADVKVKLQSHLNDEEIEALLKRKDLIIDKINVLIQEKGEDAVLF
jgi:hypothetical protein